MLKVFRGHLLDAVLIGVLFYPLYQSAFVFVASFGGFGCAFLISTLTRLKSVCFKRLPPKLYFVYSQLFRRCVVFGKYVAMVVLFYIFVTLFCYGNLFAYSDDIPALVTHTLTLPITAWYNATIYSHPLYTFGGLLFLPFFCGFCYYLSRHFCKYAKVLRWVTLGAITVIVGLYLPYSTDITLQLPLFSVALFQIPSAYFYCLGAFLVWLRVFLHYFLRTGRLSHKQTFSALIYGLIIVLIVCHSEFNSESMLTLDWIPNQVWDDKGSKTQNNTENTHVNLLNTPAIEQQNSAAIIDDFRSFSGSPGRLEQTVLTITAPANPLNIKFATFNELAPDGLKSSLEYVPSAITGNQETMPGSKSVSTQMQNYPYRTIPLAEIVAKASAEQPRNSEITAQTNSFHFMGNNAFALNQNVYYNEHYNMALTDQSIGNSALSMELAPRIIALSTDNLNVMTNSAMNMPKTPQNSGNTPNFNAWFSQICTQTDCALTSLLDNLRGYSHLSKSRLKPEGDATWLPNPDYEFVSSDAVYTPDYLDQAIFGNILQNSNTCERKSDIKGCALASGDEVQFAIAAKMTADKLGIESNVVVGAHCNSPTTATTTSLEIAPSQGGIAESNDCTIAGKDITAWLEYYAPLTTDQSASADTAPQLLTYDTSPRTDNTLPPLSDDTTYITTPTYVGQVFDNSNSSNDIEGLKNNETDAHNDLTKSSQTFDYFELIFLMLRILLILALITLLVTAVPLLKLWRIRRLLGTNKYDQYANNLFRILAEGCAQLLQSHILYYNITRTQFVMEISVKLNLDERTCTELAKFAKQVDKICFSPHYIKTRRISRKLKSELYNQYSSLIDQICGQYYNRYSNRVLQALARFYAWENARVLLNKYR